MTLPLGPNNGTVVPCDHQVSSSIGQLPTCSQVRSPQSFQLRFPHNVLKVRFPTSPVSHKSGFPVLQVRPAVLEGAPSFAPLLHAKGGLERSNSSTSLRSSL